LPEAVDVEEGEPLLEEEKMRISELVTGSRIQFDP